MNINRYIVKFFLVFFIFIFTIFTLYAGEYNSLRKKIEDKNLKSESWNYYFELAEIRNISHEKLSNLIEEKIDYLLIVKQDIEKFKQEWIGIFLFFSDIGIEKENVIEIKHKNINYGNLKILKNFLSILKSSFDFNNDELNRVFNYCCIKNYKLDDLNILTLNLKRNLKKLRLRKNIVKNKILKEFSKGLDMKFILREISGVIDE
ncbi:MAG: hypothetical protein FXF47_02515 [Candidatus Mcinerneyibacterium aminivorans]|uniref:Uncharacterized protein n=1 Tax=Candidatus Mcinerneyibacterium aminivorans TaxID=2703815 RepID=A0A5D0MJH5_9BACT|nr:MAG: hypothetical protein FXF47_02515 [Candidatus Mcinerneyibacterium aminivorans]